jgi:hypothetical protein
MRHNEGSEGMQESVMQISAQVVDKYGSRDSLGESNRQGR